MNTATKYIGINQRVPFQVLDQGLIRFLQTGMVDKGEIKQDMREFTKGENRVSKASLYANQILTRPKALLDLISKMDFETYVKLPENERKAFVLALFAITYPIAHDLLIAMAKGYKAQPQINKKFISLKLSALYGSNRTLDIAIDALLPMLIELKTIQRAKRSIYELAPSYFITSPIVTEAYIYTDIFLSGSKSALVENLRSGPWYSFYSVDYHPGIHKNLLKFSEGKIGGGYISI